ncbi:MAG: thiamine pyrophosphate-dependent enzyme [Candidatus Azobacteroides sp.]|nr:thiamine pyrophosphate-dependent enzyme [Candidatus Azobacteroides sp.]
MGKKVADQLVEALEKSGVKRIYAVTGDSLNEVNDAVRRKDNIEWVHVRHEEVGAFAAAAEGDLNGIGCCAGSSGPGHIHLINGLYEAHRSDIPVFAIASMCPSSEMGTSYFQETNPMRLFSDCSGYNEVATTPVQFSRMLQASLQHAIHKKDVSVIGLPGDLAANTAIDSPTASFAIPSQSICCPESNNLKAAAEMINQADKITIYCGIGAKDAHKELIELAGMLKAPVGYTFRSKMAIQYNNPYEVGMTGLLGFPSAFSSMHTCDLLILLGTDFPYESFMPDKCKIIQVDLRPERIGRRAKVDIGLAGDVKATLESLLPLLKEKESEDFLNTQLKLYGKVKENLTGMAFKKGEKGNISPEFVAYQINKHAPEDAIFTVDTGMCCVWGARYLQATGKREMLGSFSHGTMANAMPMAIGAAFARPNQQVIALCGDGGISMLLGDLATIVQYKLPIKLVVFNNRSLGMVKLEMEVAGLPDWQTDMYNPDFAAVAEAMGMKAFTVNRPVEVEITLKEAFKIDGPVLINVKTDSDALAMPPKVEFDQVKGFANAMIKLVLAGRSEEVWETAKSNIKHIWSIF